METDLKKKTIPELEKMRDEILHWLHENCHHSDYSSVCTKLARITFILNERNERRKLTKLDKIKFSKTYSFKL